MNTTSHTGPATAPVPRVDAPVPRGVGPGGLDGDDGHGPGPTADGAGRAGGPRTATTTGPGTGAPFLLRRPRTWFAGDRWPRRRVALVALVLVLVAAVVLATVNPFAAPRAPTTSKHYALYTVTRQTLTSQTQVTATLGYSGSYAVTAPAGTSSQSLMQAQEAVTSDQAKVQSDRTSTSTTSDAAAVSGDRQSLAAAQATLQSDQAALQTARASLTAAQEKEANDCAGTGSTSQTCAADQQAAAADQQQVSGDQQKVTQDQSSVSQDQAKLSQDQAKQAQDASQAQSTLTVDEQKLADDQAALAAAEEQATIQTGAISQLPAVGQVVSQGQTLYTVITTPVVLLYGATPATRNLFSGERGADVAQLNGDLRAMGYTTAPAGAVFTAGTAAAVRAFQAHIGVPQTGNLALGQVVFLPTAARVTAVTAVLGTDAQPGTALFTATSTTRQVAISLDANLQGDVKMGDHVTITLPNQHTTPGVVSYVGTVATVPSNSGGGTGTRSSTPTIQVGVTPTDPSAIGAFDQAPVSVSITNASVKHALVVPVNALLALSGGGYALEVVPPHGHHYLVPVSTGLFDDAQGLVQVTGAQVRPGLHVVVPST